MTARTVTSERGWRQIRASVCRARRNPLLWEFTALAGSTGVLQVGNFVLTLLLAQTLGPSSYGAWTAMTIFAGYVGYLHLGVINAMHREVPASIGAGLPGRAAMIQRTAWSGVIASSAIGALIILGMPARLVIGSGDVVALRLMAVFLCGQQAYSYMTCYLRATTQFYLLSRQQVLLAAGLLVVTLPLSLWAGLRGAVFGQSIVYLAISAIGLSGIYGGALKWRGLNWSEWRQLTRIGLPIMIVGVGHYVLMTFDRLVVLYCGGTEFMGQYAFQSRILSLSPLIASVVADQLYPRASAAYGRSPAAATLIPFFQKQIATIGALTVAATALLYAGVPPLVRHFLPAYAGGLRVMPVLLAGTAFLALCSACGVVLTVMNMQGRYLLTQAALIPFGIGVAILLSRTSLGNMGPAWATTITYALYFLIMLRLTTRALWPSGRPRSIRSCAN